MRKSLLVLGAVYIVAGAYGLVISQRMQILYQQFNAKMPTTPIPWGIVILFFGILNLIVYFSKSKSINLQKLIIFLGVLGIVCYFGLTFYSKYKVTQVNQRIEENRGIYNNNPY